MTAPARIEIVRRAYQLWQQAGEPVSRKERTGSSITRRNVNWRVKKSVAILQKEAPTISK
jgi:hypothetical protein